MWATCPVRHALASAARDAGAGCLAAGWLLDWSGVCPGVKRIWTPSWVLYSGGWCFLLLAAFYSLLDVWNRKAWALPLVVISMAAINSAMKTIPAITGHLRLGLVISIRRR